MRKPSTAYKPCVALAVGLTAFADAGAKCGSVDYSWGAGALATMHDYVVTMMLYTVYVCYAIAAMVVIYSSMQIYIKMNIGEEGVVKDMLMVAGACLFMIGAAVVLPAFFGYRI